MLAAEPGSPLSPFSAQSSPARDAAIGIYREVVGGSSARIGPDLLARLPELFWLYSMGIIAYWVHDTSQGCARTYRLIEMTAPIAGKLVAAARVPMLRGTVRDIIAILDELRS